MVDIPDEYIWIVVVGFITAFVLCLGIGANDVANTFGTSVGSKVLTLRQACILATIFETAGAVLLGAKVSETVRKGIIDVELYENSTEQFLLGNVAALSGSAVWLFIATAAKLPVSATHSIVGATVGFALVANGAKGIDWVGLGKIVASWFVSPVMSGLITIGIFLLCDFFILRKADPLEPGLKWLPIFYGVTFVVNIFSIFYDGPEMLEFDRIPLWGVFILSFGTGLIIAILVRFLLIPWQRKRIIEECSAEYMAVKQAAVTDEPVVESMAASSAAIMGNDTLAQTLAANTSVQNNNDGQIVHRNSSSNLVYPAIQIGGDHKDTDNNNTEGIDAKKIDGEDDSVDIKIENLDDADGILIKDRPETSRLFSFLQILTAVFGAFAHGGNDVSNGIGPLISIWLVAINDDVNTTAITPLWLLAYGGFGISVGLWLWGRRVIETMGEDLTTITPSSGFAIELGAALTVLFASNIGLPISSTHCKVGSIVFVGRLRSKGNVDWSLFRNIVLSWVITLPATIAFSAAFMALLQLSL